MKTIEAFNFCVNADKLLSSGKELPVKIHFALRRDMNALMPLYNAFNDTRMDVIKRYAKKDENGDTVTDASGNAQIGYDNIEKVNKELNDIASQESDINIPIRITEEDLMTVDCKLSTEEYNALQFITEGGE